MWRTIIIEEIYQIFDKTFKKVLTLSTKAVINLINGMFHTDYPLDSTITYNWTEFEDDNLKRILADAILTINGTNAYHLEAQMEKDDSIVFRVFEYSFSHANRTRIQENGEYILQFPRPMVIYLYYEKQVPDEYTLKLTFNEGKDTFDYKVPVLKLPELSSQELCDRKMVILIPFHILRLRYELKKGSFDDVEELQRYILNDIIGHIDENVRVGNITIEDALKLKRYLQKLCEYLSKHYKELEAMKDMTDESFMTDIDIMCKEHEEAMAVKEAKLIELNKQLVKIGGEIEEKDKQLEEKEEQLEERDKQLEEKEEQLMEKDKQLEKLQQQLVLMSERIKKLEEKTM